MIQVRELTKIYGPTVSINGLSFEVGEGEVLGFLGPNGAGKSTTMRILTGLARPTQGTARVGGFDVQKENEKVRRLIGYCPERAPLYDEMTLAGYLEFMGGIRGLNGREARREMERTTELVNLQKERRRLLRNLSKGTRQRAAIAQSLLGDPKVLILDEPTAGLDPSQIGDVRELIRAMAGNRTVILSTHILPEVEMTCSRVVIIAAGRIVAKGTPEELVGEEKREIVVIVRGDREKFEKILKAHGPLNVKRVGESWHGSVQPGAKKDPRAQLAKDIVGAGLELIELRSATARLEDVFLRAIGRRQS